VCDKVLSDESGAVSRYFPFCSDRCRQIDIYRWCTGKYAIVEPVDPEWMEEDGPQE
jgi:endogenous inhibitor of DNA gyrase (YacG/DUF329 family)